MLGDLGANVVKFELPRTGDETRQWGLTGVPDGVPTRVGVPIADIAAGMFAAYAVVAALYWRERDPERRARRRPRSGRRRPRRL
jgi:crotonobetainyl-CoA:carnitine CoA-transferase CaiB-like acyl-CoA transferase